MTREEAILLMKSSKLALVNPKTNEPISDLYYALDMAIKALEQEYPSECREIREDERRKTIAEFRDAFNKTLKILNEEPCETCKHDGRDPLKAPCVYCMYAKNSMWEQK